jgi:hypothetical protein
MVYPDRCVDQHVWLARSAATPSRHGLKASLAAPESRQAPRALARDERFEARPHYSSFLLQAAQSSRLPEKGIIDDQCSSHMH